MKIFKLLAVSSVFLLVYPMGAISGSISGNLVMPTPYSQSSDMTVNVRAFSNDDPVPRQNVIVITAAEAAAGFSKSFSITGLLNGVNYSVQYDCNSFASLEECKNIVPRTHYLANGQSTVRIENAPTFSGSNDTTGLDFQVLVGNTITGTVFLPSGTAPAVGLTYSVSAQTVNAPIATLTVGSNLIAAGNASQTYKVTIPNDNSEDWTIGYICTDGGHCDNFLPFGFRKSGATNDTVENVADADSLAGNIDSPGQDMTLLEGFSISGTLSVPAAVTQASGLTVNIGVQDDNNASTTFETIVTIPQNETSIDYLVTVSLDAGADWALKYSCNTVASPIDCAPYITEAFYDESEATNTTANIANLDTLGGGVSHTNIDMAMIGGNSITGKLILSEGVAPVGGISFTVRAVDVGFNGNFVSSVTIAEGDSEVDYLINVDDDDANNYRMNFNCTETITIICNSLSDLRFYDANSGDTVNIEGDAGTLVGDLSHTNIDMVVLSSALNPALCVPIKTAGSSSIALICL